MADNVPNETQIKQLVRSVHSLGLQKLLPFLDLDGISSPTSRTSCRILNKQLLKNTYLTLRHWHALQTLVAGLILSSEWSAVAEADAWIPSLNMPKIKWAACGIQGSRQSMEDVFFADSFTAGHVSISLFAIADGHGTLCF